MAAKVRCPACGAKNALDVRRCRICTAVVNADIPAGGAIEDKPAPVPEPSFDAGQINRQMGGGRAAFAGSSGLGARLAAAGNAPEPAPLLDPPPDVTAAAPQAPEWSAATTFSNAPVPGGQAPAPTDAGAFETFDPDALFDAPPPSNDAAPTDGPSVAFEPFDPDALFRDS